MRSCLLKAQSRKIFCTWNGMTRIFTVSSMLQHFVFKTQSPDAVTNVQSLLQVGCGSAINGLWLQCQLQELLPLSPEPMLSHSCPTTNQPLATHIQSCLWACRQIRAGNQFILKVIFLGLREQPETGGYARHPESKG